MGVSALSVTLCYSSCRMGVKSQREQVACPEGDLRSSGKGLRQRCGRVGRGQPVGLQAGPLGGTQRGGLHMSQTPAPVSCGASLPWVLREAACCCSCGNVLVGGERVCRKKQSVLHRGTVRLDVKGKRAESVNRGTAEHLTASRRKSPQRRDRKGRIPSRKAHLSVEMKSPRSLEDKRVEMQPQGDKDEPTLLSARGSPPEYIKGTYQINKKALTEKWEETRVAA